MVKDAMNPFDGELDPTHLYNIGTGEAASDNRERLRKFIYECIEDPNRFEMRIPRRNLLTFASEAGKHKPKKTDKVVAACLVRDLFGCILYHSLQQNIDMAEVL